MKLFLILQVVTWVCLFGKIIIHKNQLRGYYEKEKYRMIHNSIIGTYNSVYTSVLDYAKQGKTEYSFTIMCKEELMNRCQDQMKNNNNICQDVWKQQHPNNILDMYNITREVYTNNVITMLNETFPDSITTKYKNCCDYYIIS